MAEMKLTWFYGAYFPQDSSLTRGTLTAFLTESKRLSLNTTFLIREFIAYFIAYAHQSGL